MGFRTIIIDSHSKLEYSLEYLVFRTVDSIKRILLDEINLLIINSTCVSLTSSLVSELSKRKIKIIFCDEKQNPICETVNLYGSHNSSKRIFEQVNWDSNILDNIRAAIIKEKINNQAKTLYKYRKIDKYKELVLYRNEVCTGDITNREGHAAKVYFNNMYYDGFRRDDDSDINKYLNYGYTILLSCFNRCVSSHGYLTQLGIHHRNEFNQFNFSCDLIETFRFIIDEMVEKITQNKWKEQIIAFLSKTFKIDGKEQTLINAIEIYFLSVIKAINENNPKLIKFIEHAI